MASESCSLNVKSKDIGWKYAYLKDPTNKSKVSCNFCHKEVSQGINRLKQHLAGVGGNVISCVRCPESVRDECRAALVKNSRRTSNKNVLGSSGSCEVEQDFHVEGDDLDDEDDDEINVVLHGGSGSGSGSAPRPPKRRGPMDHFVQLDPGEALRRNKGKQATIESMTKKSERKKVCQYIMRWMYQQGIPFNALKAKSFKVMIEAIGQFGPGLKPPSYHEGRVTFLKEELTYTNELLKPIKDSWAKYGCSIMSDGWTDRRSRSLINFLVNNPSGTVFLESIDASSYVKTAETLFKLLDDIVEKVGEKNVIQVITDNAAAYVAAGRMLMEKRRHLFWTPCAAHCIDLMLEDIGAIPRVKGVIQKAIFLSGFIYNHGFVLNLMRTYTHDSDIIRPAVTRFATSFLTLQSIYRKRDELKKMFTSDEWNASKWPRDAKGIRACGIVFSNPFWNGVIYAMKISGPLVKVLRLVDAEKAPPMGYIYEAMDRAKETIKKALEEDNQE